MSGRIVGVLIGIALMQTCRSLVTNKGASENTRQKAEDIIYSSNNYCPELAESIRQRDYSGKSKVLKLLSEMLRSSPEGSKFRDQVNAVITKLLTNNQKDKESIQQDVAALFNQYLPVVCEGDLQVAKMDAGGNPESTSIPEDFSKAQLTYARAICSALRSNEKMETMDEMRSVGAVYMGREMDLLANEDKIQTMKELANQTGNSKWISQATVAVVKECPEDAYKMAEE
jgi:hypothetical protein